jgi:hypothetical protein
VLHSLIVRLTRHWYDPVKAKEAEGRVEAESTKALERQSRAEAAIAQYRQEDQRLRVKR